MASQKKLTMESELIAIYRLKFYKNKKDWKLGSDEQKVSPSSKDNNSKKKLDKTYDLKDAGEEEVDAAGEEEADAAAPLNKAFLELSVDKFESPPPSPTLIPIPSSPSLIRTPPPPTPPPRLPPRSPFTPRLPPPPSPPSTLIANVPPTRWSTQWDQAEREHDWMNTDWCRVTPQCPPPLAFSDLNSRWTEVSPPLPYEQTQYVPPSGAPRDPPPPAEEPPPMPRDVWDHEFEPYEACEVQSNSLNDFIRGAHGAPHSSEIDLDIKCGCDAVPLHSLSSRHLREALRLHAAVIRRLLQEHTYRHTLYSQAPLPRSSSLDSIEPVRDCAGPGRGSSCERNVIRIDAGRPYRL